MVQTHLHLQALRYEPKGIQRCSVDIAAHTVQATNGTQVLGAAIACVAGLTDEEVSASQAYTSSLM